jgi:hypothetical protein
MKQQKKDVQRYSEGDSPELPGTGLSGAGSYLVPWLGEHGIAENTLLVGYRRCIHERNGICTHTAG